MSLAVLDRKHTIAPRGYNRWLIPPAALAIHLCIGQAYATSVYKTSPGRRTSTPARPRSASSSRIAIVMLGLSAAVARHLGRHAAARAGDVRRGLLLVAGLPGRRARHRHRQLWLLYLGYGVIGGIGLGHRLHLAGLHADQVVPGPPGPRHRPGDHGLRRRRAGRLARVESKLLALYDSGFDPKDATSVASGSAVACDVRHARHRLLRRHAVRRLADQGARRRLASRRASTRRRSRPSRWSPPRACRAANAVKTPQFWLLWVVLFCNVTAGIGILEQAAPMIQDFFRAGGDSSVDPAAAAGFVGLLSIFNMAGRFVWSSTSDVDRPQADLHGATSASAWSLYALLAIVGHTSTGAVRAARRHHHLVLRRRVRDRAGLPARPVRHLPGRRDPRPAAHRLVGRRCRRAADRQRLPRRRGHARQADRTTAYQPALLTMVGVLAVGFVANLLIRQVADRFHEPDHEETQLTGEPADGGGVAHRDPHRHRRHHDAAGAAGRLLGGRRPAAASTASTRRS